MKTFAEAEQYEIERRRRNAASEASRTLDRSQRYMARTGTDDSSVMSQVGRSPTPHEPETTVRHGHATRNVTMNGAAFRGDFTSPCPSHCQKSCACMQAAVASWAVSESGNRVRELSRLRPSGSALQYAVPLAGSAAAQLAAWRKQRGVPLDITALPGTDALSHKVITVARPNAQHTRVEL